MTLWRVLDTATHPADFEAGRSGSMTWCSSGVHPGALADRTLRPGLPGACRAPGTGTPWILD